MSSTYTIGQERYSKEAVDQYLGCDTSNDRALADVTRSSFPSHSASPSNFRFSSRAKEALEAALSLILLKFSNETTDDEATLDENVQYEENHHANLLPAYETVTEEESGGEDVTTSTQGMTQSAGPQMPTSPQLSEGTRSLSSIENQNERSQAPLPSSSPSTAPKGSTQSSSPEPTKKDPDGLYRKNCYLAISSSPDGRMKLSSVIKWMQEHCGNFCPSSSVNYDRYQTVYANTRHSLTMEKMFVNVKRTDEEKRNDPDKGNGGWWQMGDNDKARDFAKKMANATSPDKTLKSEDEAS